MTPEQLMLNIGFPPTETGPYVTELREHIARQMAYGMTNRSAGTFAEECYARDENRFITGYNISPEERARAMLEMDWAMENGHSYRTECIDPPIGWRYNVKTMRRTLKVRWSRLLPWVGDRFREAAMRWRIRRGGQNPYRNSRT